MGLCDICALADRTCPVWSPGKQTTTCAGFARSETREKAMGYTEIEARHGAKIEAVKMNSEGQTLEETLAQRGESHGDAAVQFAMAQAIKEAMRGYTGGDCDTLMAIEQCWSEVPPAAREALEMIVHKMTRIVCGQADFSDHWHDIQGYAKVAQDRVCKDG